MSLPPINLDIPITNENFHDEMDKMVQKYCHMIRESSTEIIQAIPEINAYLEEEKVKCESIIQQSLLPHSTDSCPTVEEFMPNDLSTLAKFKKLLKKRDDDIEQLKSVLEILDLE
jgi:hypothetical protein